MENASKALIIAGAILLSMLIIALGIKVYKDGNATAGKLNLSAQEISSHNSQFEAFEGKQSGSQVLKLCNMIARNNTEYPDRKIKVFGANWYVRRSELLRMKIPVIIWIRMERFLMLHMLH